MNLSNLFYFCIMYFCTFVVIGCNNERQKEIESQGKSFICARVIDVEMQSKIKEIIESVLFNNLERRHHVTVKVKESKDPDVISCIKKYYLEKCIFVTVDETVTSVDYISGDLGKTEMNKTSIKQFRKPYASEDEIKTMIEEEMLRCLGVRNDNMNISVVFGKK